jgi:DNA processing protein
MPGTDVERKDMDLLALCSIPVLGPVLQRRLISAFGSPSKVFGARTKDIASVEGVGLKRADAVRGFNGFKVVRANIERLEGQGVRVVTEGSDQYPDGLRDLGDYAPLVFYMKGNIVAEDKFALAVVGSRMPTDYGLNVAERLSAELAAMGFTIVSGLAKGIDTAAHIGALTRGGRSIAVLGSGIDVPYPSGNRGLLERMARDGAVISEFPPGTRPFGGNFPRRNRLISGLSMGVVVVEAASRSGAIITANHALEQGKEVFAVPGSIYSSTSDGANTLIKQGARVVVGANDIVEELAPLLKGFIRKEKAKEKTALNDAEKAICDIMSKEPVHIDDISRGSGLHTRKALGLLLGLELKGIVRQTAGTRFSLE